MFPFDDVIMWIVLIEKLGANNKTIKNKTQQNHIPISECLLYVQQGVPGFELRFVTDPMWRVMYNTQG